VREAEIATAGLRKQHHVRVEYRQDCASSDATYALALREEVHIVSGQRAADLGRRTAELRPGTVLGREWTGRMHRVAVLTEGFAWNGKTFVFTAGIGENSASIRARVTEGLAWLGAKLDTEANSRGGMRISSSKSRISIYVVPTDEELMIARHTMALISAQGA
jgi:hypothetical protein